MSDFNPDIKAIKKLATLLTETGLSEIEYAEGDKRIRCVRTISVGDVAVAALSPAVPAVAPTAMENVAPKTAVVSGTPVLAPMVGTVYLSPEPGAPPFVRAGDKVKKGDTLLIIEAMKVMNPIKALANGEVSQIFVSDAKPVEYGEILLSFV